MFVVRCIVDAVLYADRIILLLYLLQRGPWFFRSSDEVHVCMLSSTPWGSRAV